MQGRRATSFGEADLPTTTEAVIVIARQSAGAQYTTVGITNHASAIALGAAVREPAHGTTGREHRANRAVGATDKAVGVLVVVCRLYRATVVAGWQRYEVAHTMVRLHVEHTARAQRPTTDTNDYLTGL